MTARTPAGAHAAVAAATCPETSLQHDYILTGLSVLRLQHKPASQHGGGTICHVSFRN